MQSQMTPPASLAGTIYWEKYNFRKTATAIGTGFLLMTLLPFAVSFGVGLLGRVQPEWVDFLLTPYGQLLYQLFGSILMFALPYSIAVWMQYRRFSEVIAFERPTKGRFLPILLISLALCMVANVLGGMFTQFLSNIGLTAEMADLPLPNGFTGVALSILTVAVEPALLEEFALRGVVLGSLRRYGDGLAIIVSSILFSAMHGNLEQIPFTFLMGIVLGFSYVKTESIWTPIAIHFFNNLISILLSYTVGDAAFTAQVLVQSLLILVLFGLGFIGLRMITGREADLFSFREETESKRKQYLGWFFSAPVVVAGLAVIALQILILIIYNLL